MHARKLVRLAAFAVLVACAAPSPPPARHVERAERALPPDATRFYTIWLGGGRVGTATETETWAPAGVHLRRAEAMRFLRGDAEVDMLTTIDIDADAALHAERVRWSERSGDRIQRAEVVRSGDAWRFLEARGASDPTIAIPADATPAELAPLLVRRDGRFAGAVFLAARGFVSGRGRIEPVAPERLVARLDFAADGSAAGPALVAEATIDQGDDRMPERIVDGDGVIAIRATAALANAPFAAIDLVAATAVPITGARAAGARLALEGDLALPPVPGQAATTSASGISLALSPELPGALPPGEPGPDRTADIYALVDDVRARVTPDLGAPAASPRDADAATAGDCTTFALAYAALAERSGIPTRVVTGLRVDHDDATGDRLVRHRWAVSWTGRAWIAVDAAFGQAPAGGDLVGLAVGDPDDAGLVAGDAALAHVRGASWE